MSQGATKITQLAREEGAAWQARCDLAAAYRIAALYGWANITYNHISLRVPGQPRHFFVKRNDMMFDEVTASSLLTLDLDGAPVGEDRNVNAAGFTIHSAVLRARPDVNCVVHVHTPAGMAMSARRSGLLPAHQGALLFYNRLAYHDYEGLSDALAERERLARDLGPHKAMILRNHGLLTCAATPALALILMKYLIDDCETQLLLEASGGALHLPSPELCERAAQQWEEYLRPGQDAEWGALLRWLERKGAGGYDS
ncbi:MAG TPA: class II aldolase/adducin family protein [Kiloniellales bacterium]|nr:class II aldolase/adducin family protein [Kiloniellales bacterium]